MKKEVIFTLNSPHRDQMRITGFRFGEGEKSCAVIGALRGNEISQLYTCARLVEILRKLEADGKILPGKEILVIPSGNNFSMNIGKRFWAMDNTDINRMFPGYSLGETTQRIAHAIFESVKDYEIGIQLPSFYLDGNFIPHIRMMNTEFKDPEMARGFGLAYILIRSGKPYDTTTLNYNLQLWERKAFSLYVGQTDYIDDAAADFATRAILRFLGSQGIISCEVQNGLLSEMITDENMQNVRSHASGLLRTFVTAGENVREGQILGEIINPYDASVREILKAKISGPVFFSQKASLIYERAVVFRIVSKDF